MDTRNTLHARQRARGAVRPVTLVAIAVIVLLAIASWFLIIQPHQEIVLTDAGGHPSTPVMPGTVAATPPPANVEAMGTDQLLSEARKAMNEQRYLAPAGNNAYEFYLKALEREPGNAVATDALRETFPFAASAAEQAINARNFNEAQREIDLLAKADPANFTLTILRSKLDAQRKLLDKEQQQALDQERQQQLAAQRAAEEKAAAEKAATEAQAAAAAPKKPDDAATRATAATQPSAQPSAPAAAKAEPATTPAVLVRSVNPRYPTQAQRARTEGYVVVSFTVTAEGRTSNIKVVDAQPRRVFDRAATDAVERWEFKPATRDGQPVDSVVTNRINFRL
ncbi:energy transducer TonB [Dyella sp.]|jgi:protein TonB|uniref:energy transducer TonB n=1 Tax=Dyella sp. TaxID=1869338 RepID=UPI002D793FB5|nr:energy transducer TonB [Dyella sp.]HET6430792.1 energy transducer TonB [Dyella sp.]